MSGQVCNSGVLCGVGQVCYVPSLVWSAASQVFYMSSQQVLYVKPAGVICQASRCYMSSQACKSGVLCIEPFL